LLSEQQHPPHHSEDTAAQRWWAHEAALSSVARPLIRHKPAASSPAHPEEPQRADPPRGRASRWLSACQQAARRSSAQQPAPRAGLVKHSTTHCQPRSAEGCSHAHMPLLDLGWLFSSSTSMVCPDVGLPQMASQRASSFPSFAEMRPLATSEQGSGEKHRAETCPRKVQILLPQWHPVRGCRLSQMSGQEFCQSTVGCQSQ